MKETWIDFFNDLDVEHSFCQTVSGKRFLHLSKRCAGRWIQCDLRYNHNNIRSAFETSLAAGPFWRIEQESWALFFHKMESSY